MRNKNRKIGYLCFNHDLKIINYTDQLNSFFSNHQCLINEKLTDFFEIPESIFNELTSKQFTPDDELEIVVSLKTQINLGTRFLCRLEKTENSLFKLTLFELDSELLIQESIKESIVTPLKNVINLSDSMSFIHYLVNYLPVKAALKSATDFSYLLINNACLDLLCVPNRDYLKEKSDYDIAKHFMNGRWSRYFVDELHEKDLITIEQKSCITYAEQPFLNKNGKVIQQTITKLPVFDESHDVIGVFVLAMENNITQNIFQLRNLYQKLYTKKSEGHMRFLEHIGLTDTIQIITPREFDVLILTASGKSAKEGAKILNMSFRTFEQHIENLKLKTNLVNKSLLIDLYWNTVNNLSDGQHGSL